MIRDPHAPPPTEVTATPPTVADGVRWLATATLAVVLATIAAALRGADGARPIPLALVGLGILAAGSWQRRRRPDGPVGETAVVLGAAVLLLAAEAFLRPGEADLDAFLAIAGAALVILGFVWNDRRPVVLGVVQWAVALGRPHPDADVFRHCLVATDLAVPHPRLLPLAVLGVGLLAVASLALARSWRPEAVRGLETTGLALLLGGLAAKALELPGHPVLCGTGDAIDTGWALLLLALCAGIGAIGVARSDRLWAGAALAVATTFAVAAVALERNPWWGALVGSVLLVGLARIEHAGIRWPRRRPSP